MVVMFMTVFLSWWYKNGWFQIIRSINPRTQEVLAFFSVSQISRTLFAPWRRIITYSSASLEAKIRAWFDNLFSRTVGFIVRLIVLFTALIIVILVSLSTLIEILLWPILPPMVISFLILGIFS